MLALLIVVAYFPGALNTPCREGSVVAFIELFEELCLRVPGDSDLVGFVGLEIQFDAATGKGLLKGMAAVSCAHNDIPFAVLIAGLSRSLSGKDVVVFFDTCTFALA